MLWGSYKESWGSIHPTCLGVLCSKKKQTCRRWTIDHGDGCSEIHSGGCQKQKPKGNWRMLWLRSLIYVFWWIARTWEHSSVSFSLDRSCWLCVFEVSTLTHSDVIRFSQERSKWSRSMGYLRLMYHCFWHVTFFKRIINLLHGLN